MIYLTSDTHFNHKKANEIIGRPFNSVEEADNEMIKRWNKIVKPDNSIVYHLGDFSFGNFEDWTRIIDQLNFKQLIIIAGNHDSYKILKKIEQHYKIKYEKWPRVKIIYNGGLYNINHENIEITLSHYPMLSWNKVHYNFKGENKLVSINLFGHHHGKLMEFANPKTPWLKYQFDVGVDGNNFYPYILEEVISKIKGNYNEKN